MIKKILLTTLSLFILPATVKSQTIGECINNSRISHNGITKQFHCYKLAMNQNIVTYSDDLNSIGFAIGETKILHTQGYDIPASKVLNLYINNKKYNVINGTCMLLPKFNTCAATTTNKIQTKIFFKAN